MVPETFDAQVGSQRITLPVIPVGSDLSIALMMVIDHGVSFVDTAGRELAQHFDEMRPEIVVAPATLGIPIAIAVTRALGLDDYLILQKTRKVHLGDALEEPVHAITSTNSQSLLLDRARLASVAARRVLFVDDVISSGSSVKAALTLLQRAGADIVGVGSLLVEGDGWPDVLDDYSDRLYALGRIPLFPHDS
ncbi:adenine phosphoribosyltransferase [Microbacterium endophyticum]|uniref:Adenine phosphoribosyltransferase n=1 Tax=Microbacterium endophyticum TaxID=1526412 RepID=A0A7W4YMK1_9MICO|nr:phosphoribosyltransferase family protein [Microbacterium endophyticum]MBB2975564.1 adenine phosphoribosyltransferase [Microbacterium endophyticum]NIK35417.1 adenine phosphoribosyltransferase [Microbacterium endophyticum]